MFILFKVIAGVSNGMFVLSSMLKKVLAFEGGTELVGFSDSAQNQGLVIVQEWSVKMVKFCSSPIRF